MELMQAELATRRERRRLQPMPETATTKQPPPRQQAHVSPVRKASYAAPRLPDFDPVAPLFTSPRGYFNDGPETPPLSTTATPRRARLPDNQTRRIDPQGRAHGYSMQRTRRLLAIVQDAGDVMHGAALAAWSRQFAQGQPSPARQPVIDGYHRRK